ncbi:SH3 domain-containing protein [Billgrantia montanilacus]|uniref:SH3 domain-containing protein n=1 Tax=Billgrantia montanilacus TaxID=2282305 RepID=A0A368TUM0_9GAMM|nr:SH3 domain-containing protein [Halomonas montanilacus]RCV87957.1 SH3 domain-containing protein [Halomonas montanilacus]
MRGMVQILVAGYFSLATVLAASAAPVLVQGEEVGQGVLRVRSGECFAIVPEHVIGFGLGLSVMSAGRVWAPASLETTYGDDIAVIRVASQGKITCGTGWPVIDSLDATLTDAVSRSRQGAILRVRETGGIVSYPVHFTGVDDRHVEVRPVDQVDEAFKGVSGSQLLLDGMPVGMVLAIEDGVVRAYRHDALSHLVARFFQASGPSQLPASQLPVEPHDGVAIVTERTAIREEPSQWSPVVRWLSVGQSVEITGKVTGLPWWQTREGYVRVRNTTAR